METRQIRLSPDKVDCIWWKRGFCFRGTTCYFKHNPALLGVDASNQEGQKKEEEKPSHEDPRSEGPQVTEKESEAEKTDNDENKKPAHDSTATGSSSHQRKSQRRKGRSKYTVQREPCGICLELPQIYGLLTDCDHAFCLICIREWRASGKANATSIDPHAQPDMVETTKTCPVCRKKSQYVIPSSVVPVPPRRKPGEGGSGEESPANPAKEQIIKTYLERKKRIPCKYYQRSVDDWRQRLEREQSSRTTDNTDGTSDPTPEPNAVSSVKFRPRCRFGNDCHYAHIHPETGEPHVFNEEELYGMDSRYRTGRSTFISDRLLEDSFSLWHMFRDEGARYVIEATNEERREMNLSPFSLEDDDDLREVYTPEARRRSFEEDWGVVLPSNDGVSFEDIDEPLW